VLSLTVRPAVLFVASQTLRHGGRRSIAGTRRILSANVMSLAVAGDR
jgi:hypothetical protein